jgi:nitroreductase
MENTILKAMKYRHAAKDFNGTKKISKEIFDQIIEAGRLSPSSFGLEHWKFIIVENKDLREELQIAAFNQKQITSASHTVVILNKISDVKTQSVYAQKLFESRMPKEVAEFVTGFHSKFSATFTEEQLSDWSKKQCYIAAANMMTMAAYLGVDSCPMEGFVESQVQEILKIDPKEYGIAMLLPFGYRTAEPRPKTRLTTEEIVEYR